MNMGEDMGGEGRRDDWSVDIASTDSLRKTN